MDKEECKRSIKSGSDPADQHPDNRCNREIRVDLSTFPEMNPNPIVEADADERIHYMNPAACNLMPELMTADNGHPFLQHVESFFVSINNEGSRTIQKEMRIGERYYQQNMHYIEKCGHVRIYGFDITDKKEAELTLVRLLQERDSVFNAVMTPLFIVDVNSRVVMSNPAAVAFYGMDTRGLKAPATADMLSIRHPDGSMVSPEELPSFRALQGEMVKSERHVVIHPAGRKIIVESSAAPIYDGVHISGAVVALHEVTEREELLLDLEKEISVRRRIAAELLNARDELEDRIRQRTFELEQLNTELIERISEVEEAREMVTRQSALLEAFFEDSLSPLVFLDKDFNFIRVNQAYARACQRDISEFLGYNHFDLYPNEENESIFRKVVADKKPYVASAKPFSFPDHPEWGTTYWDWILSPILNETGRVSSLVFSLRDVTESRRQRLALEEREKLLQVILESLPVGVWIHDDKGRIIHINRAGKEVWHGAKYSGIDRFGDLNAWWPKTGKKIGADEWAVARAVTKGEMTLGEEIRIRCFDGTSKILLNSAIPIRNEEGALAGAITVSQDITERKRAERKMSESRENLRILASKLVLAEEAERKRISMLLHDRIAQMLAAAKMKLALVDKEQASGAPGKIVFEIRELINKSLRETRNLMMEISPPILYELGFVAAVEWLTEQMSREYAVDIHFKHEGNFDSLQHDMSVLLFQTIREFLVNAGKHSLAKGVTVAIRGSQDVIEIQVADDGVGFDVSNIGQPTSEGGYGLFGVRERLKSYGGDIKIMTAKDRGTNINLTVPLLSKRKKGRKAT